MSFEYFQVWPWDERGARSGLADPVTLAVVAGVCLLFGVVFGHGVVTRSIIVNQSVRIAGDGNRVELTANTNTIQVQGGATGTLTGVPAVKGAVIP